MSFLELNGISIPAVGGRIRDEEIGGRAFAFNGSPQIDRRAIKRRWRFATNSLTPSEAKIVAGLLRAGGDVWPFDFDVFSSKGVIPLTAIDDPIFRFAVGSVGQDPVTDENGNRDARFRAFGKGALDLFPSVNNLFSANVSDGTDDQGDTTGFSEINGPLPVFLSSTARALQESRSLQFTFTANGGIATEWVAVSSGNYQGSVYLFSTSAVSNIDVSLEGDVSGLTTQSVSLIAGEWRRVVVTKAVASDTQFRLTVTRTTSLIGSVYADCFLFYHRTGDMLAGPPPGWIFDGSDAVPMKIPSGTFQDLRDVTISFWILGGSPTANGYIADFEFDRNEESGEIQLLQFDRVSGTSVRINVNGIEGDTLVVVEDILGDNDWHHIAFVSRRNPDGENAFEGWVDGVLEGSATGKGLEFGDISGVWIGDDISSPGSWSKTRMDELLVAPFAADSAAIAVLSNTSRELEWSQLPKLRASGDFLSEDESVMVVPLLTNRGYRGRQIEAAWENAMQSIEFELHEV